MKYYDIDGNDVSLLQLIKKEPEWAERRMAIYESDITMLRERIEQFERTLKKLDTPTEAT